MISLTQTLQVENGGHILYVFTDESAYIENAISFIETGIQQSQQTIFVDSRAHFAQISARLQRADLAWVHFHDHTKFYDLYGDFHFERTLERVQAVTEPFAANGQAVRVWGEVVWGEHPCIVDELKPYELSNDKLVHDRGFVAVCAYNGRRIPAYIQTEMMKTHPYFMTDDDLVHSNLYRGKSADKLPPAFATRAELESEVDLFKEKLDFVHVVSHEVRNPLTVIRAYASLLSEQEADVHRHGQLLAIVDYCTVIDHEISHILATEEMLLSETLWVQQPTRPLPLLHDVVTIMTAKARTQNITLCHQLDLDNQTTVIANDMGLKLIVSNLLSNAIKYSDERAAVHLHVRLEAAQVVIDVIDHGCGIDPVHISRLFRKYEKLNDGASGQGIGLYMVKQLTEAFQGTVAVDSTLGVGTRFTVRIPVDARSA